MTERCIHCGKFDDGLAQRGYCMHCRLEPDEQPPAQPPMPVACQQVSSLELHADPAILVEKLDYRKFIDKQTHGAGRFILGFLLSVFAWPLAFAAMVGLWILIRTITGLQLSMYGLWVFASGVVGFGLWRLGGRLRMPTAYERLRADRRRPVLLLRAFEDDFHTLPGDKSKHPLEFVKHEKTLEEFLSERFSRCGPVVAIGRPGERIPPLGAARAYIPDERWRSTVEQLVTYSQYIVVVLGKLTPGLKWELELLLQRTDIGKVILVMPSLSDPEAATRWDEYRQLAPSRLPEVPPSILAFRWKSPDACEVACVPEVSLFGSNGLRDVNAYSQALNLGG